MLMVTASMNWLSRYCTAAIISEVNPLGAVATLESQLILMMNGLGEGGSAGRLDDKLATTPDGPTGADCWEAGATASPDESGTSCSAAGGDTNTSKAPLSPKSRAPSGGGE